MRIESTKLVKDNNQNKPKYSLLILKGFRRIKIIINKNLLNISKELFHLSTDLCI